jgi:hypothetical protein
MMSPLGTRSTSGAQETKAMRAENSSTESNTVHGGSKLDPSIFRRVGIGFAWTCVLLLNLWCVAALYFDFPFPKLRLPVAIAYVLFMPAAMFFLRDSGWRLAFCFCGFVLVLSWWLTLKPSNNHDWQLDVAQTAWADVKGDTVTIHNYRDCRYRAEFDYTCQWTTKTVRLSDLRGIDVALIHWGLPDIAHLIVSFHFAGDDYIAVSIEMRKQAGQAYSSIRGFFRQYTLTYIFADERDLIRLRSNFRQGEEVDLYRTTADAEYSRKLFLQYLRRANELHERAEWYNALTSNCSTNVFSQMRAIGELPGGISRLDPRVLLSGEADKMLYDHGLLAGNLPFPELRKQALIDPTARMVGDSPDFSRLIRVGRAGFKSPSDEHSAR